MSGQAPLHPVQDLLLLRSNCSGVISPLSSIALSCPSTATGSLSPRHAVASVGSGRLCQPRQESRRSTPTPIARPIKPVASSPTLAHCECRVGDCCLGVGVADGTAQQRALVVLVHQLARLLVVLDRRDCDNPPPRSRTARARRSTRPTLVGQCRGELGAVCCKRCDVGGARQRLQRRLEGSDELLRQLRLRGVVGQRVRRLFAGRKLRKNRIGSATWIEYWPRALQSQDRGLGGSWWNQREVPVRQRPRRPEPDIADLA